MSLWDVIKCAQMKLSGTCAVIMATPAPINEKRARLLYVMKNQSPVARRQVGAELPKAKEMIAM